MNPPSESPLSPSPSSFPSVGLTAIGVAAIRAAESARPDRLFDDPYAAAFAEAAGDWRPALDHPADGGRDQASPGADHVDHGADPLSR